MARTLRWVFALLPCVPGLTLLAAAAVLLATTPTPETDARGQRDRLRVRQLVTAGGVVLLAGMMIGAGVAWRIGHPRPEPTEEEEPPLA